MKLLQLHAGALTMFFDPKSAFLRRICVGKIEIVRGIYAAVRDCNWGTVPAAISRLTSSISKNSFRIAFEVECREGDIDFHWRGRVSGSADSTVKFTFDGQALSTFARNRIGFCVLHPIRECRGARARCEQSGDRRVTLRFSRTIEPQIPGKATFCKMKSLAYEAGGGVWAELGFTGDVFEMEDQRNWTDASFKTYCTPLAQSIPVEVPMGTRIRQSVTLRLAGRATRLTVEKSPAFLEIEVPRHPTHELPHIGLGVASHQQPLTALEIKRLAALRLTHLRVDVQFGHSDWQLTLKRAIGDAKKIGLRLELAIHLPRHDGARELGELSRIPPTSIARVLVFRKGEIATSAETLQFARRFLRVLRAPIGGGTNAHFCELNRACAVNRFGLSQCDFVGWPITPQVHAFDDLSIVETLEAQPDTVATARMIAAELPLIVSPITLRPRFNAVATSREPDPLPNMLPPQVDPRQRSLFAAAWTLGSIAALTSERAVSLTYFETSGWRGIMEIKTGPPLPKKFPSTPGAVFPVYFVFASLAGFQRIAPISTFADHRLSALALFDESGPRRIILANLMAASLPVSLRMPASCSRGSFRMLDETNLKRATGSPELFLAKRGEPFEVAKGALKFIMKDWAFAALDLM